MKVRLGAAIYGLKTFDEINSTYDPASTCLRLTIDDPIVTDPAFLETAKKAAQGCNGLVVILGNDDVEVIRFQGYTYERVGRKPVEETGKILGQIGFVK